MCPTWRGKKWPEDEFVVEKEEKKIVEIARAYFIFLKKRNERKEGKKQMTKMDGDIWTAWACAVSYLKFELIILR